METKNTKLVIVESPSKIKTLKKFLGEGYEIEASVGHIRDLAKKDLGIDVDNNFKPTYVVQSDSKKVVSHLKSVLKSADELYLATDPDREGEAIAWHLIDLLKPKIPIKRLVFNEITKTAILDAFNNTRDMDMSLVSAQEARRFLDRIYGFKVSETLWFNVKGGLSAGRVQSPAVKILVDRERERAKFKQSEYWSITGNFNAEKENPFLAKLTFIGDDRVATGNAFDKTTGELNKKNTVVLNQESAETLSASLLTKKWTIKSLEKKPAKQHPYAPFITSTLQQEGIRKLRMSSQLVMRTAQSLYENGFITYMRTDSVNLSNEAIVASRKEITELYGEKFMPSSPRIYKSKAKNAQEAHEAIRPAGSTFKHPDALKTKLSDNEWKLYNLIWKRTLASQMSSAQLEKTTVTISDGTHIFEAKGKVIVFPGFLKVYVEGSDDPNSQLDNMESILPPLSNGQSVNGSEFNTKQHFTKPAPRYTEASLVKEMEALGIGRPSTYASIMKRIQDKGYVNWVKGTLIPTFTGYAVVQFLETYFVDLVNLQYTSDMEDSLDDISLGKVDYIEYLNNFYFGTDKHDGLSKKLEQEFDKNISRLIMTVNCDDGKSSEIRIGRYGIYADKDGTRITLDDAIPPSEIMNGAIKELIEKKEAGPIEMGTFEDAGEPVLLKNGRFGPYVQSGKKMKSLLPGMTEKDVTPEIAMALIALPSNIGTWENQDITKDIGKFGPYIRCGKETRSIPSEINLLEISEDQAINLLKADKKKATSVLKELGKGIQLKDGRYGAYVTDGKINATLPKALSHEEVTLDVAKQLIEEKKAKGPSKRKFKKRKK